MSNEPTRRKLFHVDIKQERVAPVLCYFVLSMIVTEVYEIGFLVAAIWCLLMFPLWWLGWWLGKMLWERRRGSGQYEYSQHEYTEMERIYDRCMDYPGRDNWFYFMVRLASYTSSSSYHPVLLGHIYNWATQWGMVLERRDQGNMQMCFIPNGLPKAG